MEYSEWLRGVFGEGKVQKISVNAGFTCPNRDGTIGNTGCLYCDNSTFSPSYCMRGGDVATQLREGIGFFSRKYPQMKYLAYFQSFTNTYGRSAEQLRSIYNEALSVEGVVGLVVGTRPDTLGDDAMAILSGINSRVPVILEIGAESSCDETLRLIRRGHTWQDVQNAVARATGAGIRCGLHLIAGLPGESRQRSLRSVEDACSLPIQTLKLHQLQIIRDTPLCRMWQSGDMNVEPFALEEYLEFCREVLRIVPPGIVIERFLSQSPPEKVVAPKWGLKNYQFMNMLRRQE